MAKINFKKITQALKDDLKAKQIREPRIFIPFPNEAELKAIHPDLHKLAPATGNLPDKIAEAYEPGYNKELGIDYAIGMPPNSKLFDNYCTQCAQTHTMSGQHGFSRNPEFFILMVGVHETAHHVIHHRMNTQNRLRDDYRGNTKPLEEMVADAATLLYALNMSSKISDRDHLIQAWIAWRKARLRGSHPTDYLVEFVLREFEKGNLKRNASIVTCTDIAQRIVTQNAGALKDYSIVVSVAEKLFSLHYNGKALDDMMNMQTPERLALARQVLISSLNASHAFYASPDEKYLNCINEVVQAVDEKLGPKRPEPDNRPTFAALYL